MEFISYLKLGFHQEPRDTPNSLQELAQWLVVGPLQHRTHIWSSETMMAFLEQMAGELRLRRRQLGLDLSHRALLVCDFASQHSSKKFRCLKEAWMRQHHAAAFIHSAG